MMKKRIFAAIDVSEATRRAVSLYVENLRGEFPEARVGWEKPEKLHLTLKFIGEANEQRLAAFLRAVEAAAQAFSSFRLQIGEAGVFPSPRRARVLWFGFADAAGSLRKLNEILESECEKEGFARESRAFKPHLTIARIKAKPDDNLIHRHLKSAFESPAPFIVPEIVVYQSELSPHGSKYSVIASAAFKPGGV